MTLGGVRTLVIGAGRSGAAAARALLRRRAVVTVLESGTAPQAVDAADALATAGARWVSDAATVAVGEYDLVVPSPGVAEHHPLLVAALAAGVEVWSEPELAWRLAGGRTRLIGVTGTNGKTTTTELIAAALDAPTGGNIGTPLVSLLDDQPAPLVVAELSSFQLRFADTLRPTVAVLLNVAPDHLDWHGSLGAYRSAKARIWARQGEGDTVVSNADDDGARVTLAEHPPRSRVLGFTLHEPRDGQVGVLDGMIAAHVDGAVQPVVATSELAVSGPHNVANVCAAVGACVAAGARPADLAPALRAYHPGRHRLEHVATVAGVDYVDDSKATNPHAAAAALTSFPPGRVVWIAGGLGKGLEFSSLGPVVRRHVRAAVTIGSSGPEIAALARSVDVAAVEAGTLAAAVDAAAAIAAPGDTVLLAPACASMDQFTDYAQRGDAFRAAVEARRTQGVTHGR